MPSLSQMGKNDLITSMAVPPNTILKVFENDNYEGASVALGPGVYSDLTKVFYSPPNQKKWLQDDISSLKVESIDDHREFLRSAVSARSTQAERVRITPTPMVQTVNACWGPTATTARRFLEDLVEVASDGFKVWTVR